MGTNYYINQKECPCCGVAKEIYHIGKSSAGWCFSLHVEPSKGIYDLPDVMSIEGQIKDEYGEILTKEEMLSIITKRKGKAKMANHDAEFLAQNNAVEGPQGLLRHKIDNIFCIGHGAGTWDLIVGEFS